VLNRPEEYHRMAEAETRLWWYRALHHLVVRALAKHPCGRQARVVDAGCGTGGLMMFLRECGYANLVGFDISPEAVAMTQQRGLSVQSGDLRHLNQIVPRESADAIVSNDTLYFFNADEQRHILNLCAQALAPGGLLILNLPALRAFRGVHDVSVGIARRFSEREVRALLSSTGLVMVRLCYWPFFLSPLIYARRLSQRLRLRRSSEVEVRSDVDLPPAPLNWTFEWLTRMENAALPWKPFGSSLFVTATKRR
jgi:SAM-dependent methyltransferase